MSNREESKSVISRSGRDKEIETKEKHRRGKIILKNHKRNFNSFFTLTLLYILSTTSSISENMFCKILPQMGFNTMCSTEIITQLFQT